MKVERLRRGLILGLTVMLICTNAMRALASTGAPEVIVSNFEELVQAVQQASNTEVVLVKNTIQIPEGAVIGDSSKMVTVKSAGGSLEIVDDPSKDSITQLTNIIFDGAGKEMPVSYLVVSGKADISGCVFKNCGINGAVNLRYAEVNFTGCSFRDNRGAYGAHLLIGYDAICNIKACEFTGGVSTNRGGAVYLDSFNSVADITDSVITGNKGAYGGGISSWGSVTLKNTMLYQNTATVGGADLFSVGTYTMSSIEELADIFHLEGIEPLRWENDYIDIDYGATCLKLIYEAYTAPEPVDPVEPIEPDNPNDNDEGGTVDPDNPTVDTPTDDPDKPSEDEGNTGGGNNSEDQPKTDESDTNISTPSDADKGGGDGNSQSTTDNSQIITDNSQSTNTTTTDNSTSYTTDTVDNSSNVSTVDNSSRSESSKTENSNNTSTVYNYYTQEERKQESLLGSNPVNVSVPVNITIPEQNKSTLEGASVPSKDINIDAKGVDVKLEIKGDSYNISITAPEPQESPLQSVATPTVAKDSTAPITRNSPSWVEYVSMILLSVLVVIEVRNGLKKSL